MTGSSVIRLSVPCIQMTSLPSSPKIIFGSMIHASSCHQGGVDGLVRESEAPNICSGLWAELALLPATAVRHIFTTSG